MNNVCNVASVIKQRTAARMREVGSGVTKCVGSNRARECQRQVVTAMSVDDIREVAMAGW